MPTTPNLLSRRYPGVTPFEREQSDLFFGRDREIVDLLRLVSQKRLLVLFGKSGHGKSSLLNAGLLPRLDTAFRGKRVIALSIRLGAYAKDQSLSPKEALLAELERSSAPAAGTDFYEKLPGGRSLWREFKRRRAGGEQIAFVLLFDQFEEFSLYPPEQQQQFRQEISELLYTDIPQRVFHEFDRLDDEAQDHLSAPLEVHAVFAIRSDRLHLLDSMKQELKNIMDERYELRGLDAEQAKAAVLRPAEAAGEGFETRPFRFEDAALQLIVDKLMRGGDDEEAGRIESFQLQIVCQSIEDDVKARNRRGEQNVVIRPGDLPDFERVFENYYATRIAGIGDPALERSARLLLEEELLYVDEAKGEARRLSMDGDALAANMLAKHGIALPPALLDALVNSFIVRREKTARGAHYEISHDTLVGPVLKSREERRRAEKEAAERERLRVEAEERERQLTEERRRRRRANLIAAFGIILSSIAIVATIFALSANSKAQEEKRNAEVARDSAQAAQRRAEDAKIKAVEARTQADTARAEADRQKLKAQRSAEETIAALRQLGKTNAYISSFITREANDDIYQINYTAAAEKLKAAYRLGQPSDSLRRAVLEVAFVYNEAGKKQKCTAFLAATGYPGAPDSQPGRRDFIRQKDPGWYKKLRARYFPAMVEVKGGEFLFGKDEEKEGIPARVSDFKLADSETTFWQFALYIEAKDRTPIRPTWGFAGDNPVVNVNWYDALDYANWLSVREGLQPAYAIDSLVKDTVFNRNEDDNIKWLVTPIPEANGYRLPTETQWEYAARGGPQQQAFKYAGSDVLEEVAWWSYNSNQIHGVYRTNAVKLKKPVSDQMKLYDLSGNVYEWCWDWYGDYPPAPPLDYTGPESGSSRCLRGGSWVIFVEYWFEVGYRYDGNADNRYVNYGFRLSQDLK